jgi:hypothetical protein
MTNLVDRYLAAVQRRLPDEKQSKDIIAELREAIASKIEAKEAQVGRTAEADDVAAVLKDFGHPVVVASRYAGREYLIGPQLYPWFWPAQRMAIGVAAAFTVTIAAIGALDSARPVSAFISGLGDIWGVMLATFAITTVVFVVLESTPAPAKIGLGWNPKMLSQDHIRARKSLFESVVTLVFDVIFILWWVRWVDFPNRLPGQAEPSVELHLSEAWATVYTPILILALMSAAVHAGDIFHPAWSRLRSAVSILGHAGGVAVMWVLLNGGRLVEVTEIAGGDTRAAQVEWWVDGPFRYMLIGIAIVWAIVVGVEVHRQIQATRPARMPAGMVV